MANDPEWLTDFTVTRDDLQRLEEWLSKINHGATLDHITRRIIRGRLRFGRDESPSALFTSMRESQVLSWNEEEKWCVGCQVLVAKGILEGANSPLKILPYIGTIVNIVNDTFFIRIEEKIIKYARPKPGSDSTKAFHRRVQESIREVEGKLTQASLDVQINTMMLKYGALIATQIRGALWNDSRFCSLPDNGRWYLQKWILEVSYASLQRSHRQLLKIHRRVMLSDIRRLIPELPEGELGDISLLQALAKVPKLFKPSDDWWLVIPPPPPPWPQAVGAYYVYDPDTHEILLEPNSPLKKKTAERLEALGWYADVVKPKDETQIE